MDSKIDILKGSNNLVIDKIIMNYSFINRIYDIFEKNIIDNNFEGLNLIRESYKNINDINKVADFSYKINNLNFKKTKSIFVKFIQYFLKFSCGFGYKPLRAFLFSIFIITGFTLVYFLSIYPYNSFGLNHDITLINAIHYSFYYSMVTFATLGYGDITSCNEILQIISGIESLLGIYAMAIVVFSITKRYNKI